MQNCTAVDEALRERLGLEEPAFVAQLLPQLMELVRASRRLPVGEEHAIRRGSKEFLAASKELGQRSMSAVQRTMRWLDPDAASGPEDLVSFNLVEDSIDTVLERVDSCIRDALAGLSRSAEAEAEPDLMGSAGGESSLSSASSSKPQVRWRELIDNDRTEFIPRLLVKHNQKVPLQASFLEAQRRVGLRTGTPGQQTGGSGGSIDGPDRTSGAEAQENSALRSHLSALGVDKDKAMSSLCHPYEEEIRLLSYPDVLFETVKPEHFARMEDTPLVWVRTARDLRQLINEVKATCVGKAIAVDVEHHDLRSYRGFVCLVQVSTRQKDFLIDPFDMFEQMHWLNEIFTDPSILKVLHGADRDVQWLQRDFSVFIVNMFDTGLATRALRLQGGFSYANLVSHYCGVKLDKKYQTADWRQRPLSSEMEHYARCDTHYLLYCFDCLRNTLLANGPYKAGEIPAAVADGVLAMRGVLDKSAALCKTQYTESPFDAADAAMRLCERFGSKQKPLESRQFSALKALAAWRDKLGRQLDESWNFVAPDASLWRVALAMPTTAARLRSTCNPLPPLLQQNSAEVVDVVVKSAEAAAHADVPQSPSFKPMQSRTAAATVNEAGVPSVSSSAHLLPPAAAAAGSAATPVSKLVATPQHQEWPPSTCRTTSPIVRVSSGSLRHLNNGSNGEKLHRSASLTSMFESESSADEDLDTDALNDLSKAFTFPPPMPSFAPRPTVAPALAPSPIETTATEPMKEEADGEIAPTASQAGQCLRDAYQMPGATRRKKKKKKPQLAAPSLAAAAAVTATVAGSSLEAEAASFRSALAAAFPTAANQQPIPGPTKRKEPPADSTAVAAAAADPYGAAAVASDPYAPSSDPYMQAAPANAAPSLAPKKKKKKIVTRQAAPIADPYL